MLRREALLPFGLRRASLGSFLVELFQVKAGVGKVRIHFEGGLKLPFGLVPFFLSPISQAQCVQGNGIPRIGSQGSQEMFFSKVWLP